MPQFAPGALKTARASITIAPSGLSCQAELYLVSGATKVATSGLIPFTSTGAAQDSAFPITMPNASATYKTYLDVFASGVLIGAYVAIEDVTIAAPAQFVYASAIRLTLGAPYYDIAVDIKNVGDGAGSCVIAISDRIYLNAWSGWGQVTDYVGGHNPAYNGGYYLRQATIQPGQTVTFSGWGIWLVGLSGVTAQQVMISSAAGSKQTGGFAYVSAIYVAGTGYWAPAGVDGYFIEVKIQNVGAGAGTCYNELWVQFGGLPWGIPMDWVWVVRNLDLAPGQVGTLRWWAPHFTGRTQQYKVVGDAGTIISPIWQLN